MYFNGGLHGYNDATGYHPPEPITKTFCDACAETQIPLPPVPGPGEPDILLQNGFTVLRQGNRHWDTGFRWAPYFGSATKCTCCGTKV